MQNVPLLFLITASNLLRKPLTTARNCSFQDLRSERFKASTLRWNLPQALDSKVDYTEKSKGLRSGKHRGHISLDQNRGRWSWHQF